MKRQRPLAILLSLVLVLGMLPSCASNSTGEAGSDTSTAQQTTSDTVEFTDQEGSTVSIPSPENLDRIAITSWKGAFTAAVLLGVTDKVKVMSDVQKRYYWLCNAFPELASIPSYGSFNDVNVEGLLQENCDVVISPSSATEANDQMKSLGMPVVVDGVDRSVETANRDDVLATMFSEIDLVAGLTGTEDVAQKYYDWAYGVLDLVSDRVSDIDEADRVRVLPIRTDMTQAFHNNYICGYVVEMAGGVNVVGDTDGSGKIYQDIDAEQIQAWDPDMIFHINFNAGLSDQDASNYLTWSSDERYADVKAMETGDVYLIPTGISQWDADVDLPLCVLWMAKIMYPDRFEDIDVKAYAEDFYKEFLNYDLTDEDWAMIAPQYTGANANGLTS